MKVAGFEWDDGNWPKCGKHGLTQDDIESVLRGSPHVMPNRNSTDESRFCAIGTTDAGRHAFIVFTIRARDGALVVRPISARYMHEKEVNHYDEER